MNATAGSYKSVSASAPAVRAATALRPGGGRADGGAHHWHSSRPLGGDSLKMVALHLERLVEAEMLDFDHDPERPPLAPIAT